MTGLQQWERDKDETILNEEGEEEKKEKKRKKRKKKKK